MMNKFSLMLCATVALGASIASAADRAPTTPAAPGASQSGSAPLIPGLGVADLNVVIRSSKAFQAAAEQRKVLYKSQIEAAEARAARLNSELKVLVDRYNRDLAAPKSDPVALQAQLRVIDQTQQAGNQEIQTILKPATDSENYVFEQISDKMPQALEAAMAKKGVTWLAAPQSGQLFSRAYIINDAIVAELDRVLPNAPVVPPQGWLPRSARDAAQKAAAPAN